jgi:hypothetical protein
VAGAAALILQARGKTKPEDVRTLLQNTAAPALWRGNPGLGLLESVHRQGAGLIHIDDAVLATTMIEPSKLSLGESEAGPQTRKLKIANRSDSPVTYVLGHVPAVGTANTFPALDFTVQDTGASFSQDGVAITEVTVPAREKVAIDVTITPDADPSMAKTVYGGYLTFTGGGHTYRVPYAGFVGDYQSLTVLDAAAAGIFPTIGRRTGVVADDDNTPVHTPVAAGAVFTMQNGDVPYVLAHFAHQARAVRIDLYSAATNELVGEALADEFIERNSRRTGTTNDANSDVYIPFALDGTVKKNRNRRTPVADGSYYAVLSVLKALGNERNAAHWENWTSQPFTIDRP